MASLLTRRQGLVGLGALASLLPLNALGQSKNTQDFSDILSRAVKVGALSPEAVPGGLVTDADRQLLLAEIVVATVSSPNPDAAGLAIDSGQALSRLNAALQTRTRKTTPPAFSELSSHYRELFDKCAVKSEHIPEIDRWIAFFTRDRNVQQYRALEKITNVPWYFIATLHLREASANFLGHLHNGDPLRALTKQVPKNRPPPPWPPNPWDPVKAWVSSADDALTLEGFSGRSSSSWTVERSLYRFEKYNGFGYLYHKVPSAYLWNFSSVSRPGGYASDGKWSSSYISRQIGAAVLIKRMMEKNIIKLSYET
ncbi:hypothetical protein [Rhizobium leguminosarum]|uniref:hypothetical protein n=1 Tax=Rhizobium leguminosarum TaxID=384 RepID=UPI002FEFDFBE